MRSEKLHVFCRMLKENFPNNTVHQGRIDICPKAPECCKLAQERFVENELYLVTKLDRLTLKKLHRFIGIARGFGINPHMFIGIFSRWLPYPDSHG
jgi:hypothetical protein